MVSRSEGLAWQERHEALKLKLLERAGYTCYICGLALSWDDTHIDHVLPKYLGGHKYSHSNMAPVHGRCNLRKSKKHPCEVEAVLMWFGKSVEGVILSRDDC